MGLKSKQLGVQNNNNNMVNNKFYYIISAALIVLLILVVYLGSRIEDLEIILVDFDNRLLAIEDLILLEDVLNQLEETEAEPALTASVYDSFGYEDSDYYDVYW